MAPIYETDLAEKRWSQDEWRNYELWEKIEIRLRNRRRLWIGATILLFLLLSAVPVVRDSLPVWRSMSAARVLAQELSRMKRVAASEERPLRLVELVEPLLGYRIERVTDCSPGAPAIWAAAPWQGELGRYPGVTWIKKYPDGYCYDPRLAPRSAAAWVIGVDDERTATVTLSSGSAEISVE